ncbi:MAG: insulinase family protein [Pseudomonadota bacterium]
MSRRSFGTLALLALAGLYSAPAIALRVEKADYDLKLIPYDINIRDYQFPSGIRIVFQEDHTRPIVSINTTIEVGAIDDPVGMDGLAHLVEHLNFRARHGDLPKNMDLIKQLGGNFNATTALDRTNYLTVAPRDALIPLLRVESLRFTDAVHGVSDEVMKVEREVVRNELRGNLEQGPGDIWGNINTQLYPEGHPYHRNVIGSHETLNNITLESIQQWVKAGYTPANATLVVVGDFDLDETGKFIQDAFEYAQLADPKNPEAPLTVVDVPPRLSAVPPEPPPPASQEVVTYSGMVDNPTIVLGWSLPGSFRGMDAQWALTVQMMNYAIGKYLFPDWDYENEEIESFGCFYNPGKVSGMALCFIEIGADEKPEKYIDSALNGLFELWNLDNFYQMERGNYVVDSLPIDRFFTYAKLAWMTAVFQSVENVSSVFGRGAEVSEWLHYTGNPLYYSAQFDELNAVNPSRAAEMAYKYLNRERHAAIVIQPLSEEEKAKVERKGLEDTYDGVTRADQGVVVFEKGELTDAVIEQAVLPLDLEQARHFTLENGLEVMIVPYGASPLARAELLFYGGTDNLDPWGLGQMIDRYLSREYSYSAMLFAGGRGESIGSVSSSFQAVGSAGNVRAMITDLREAVATADLEVMQVTKWTKDTRKARVKEEKKPETWAERALWEATFPGHVVSKYATDEQLELRKTFAAKDASAALQRALQPANAVLLVVGNIDGEATENAVRALFGDWTATKGVQVGKMAGVAPAPEPTARKILIFPKEGTTQAQIQMMCQLPQPTCENRVARQVLSSAVSDVLWLELRETSGSTYGAYAYQGEERGGIAYMAGGTLIEDAAVDLALTTMLRTLESVQQEGVDVEKLQTYKWNQARGVTVGNQTTMQVLGNLESHAARGCALESTQDYPQQIASVSNPDLQAMLERCVGHEVITIVGSKDDMLREVQEAGYEAEVVDWEQWVEKDDKKK